VLCVHVYICSETVEELIREAKEGAEIALSARSKAPSKRGVEAQKTTSSLGVAEGILSSFLCAPSSEIEPSSGISHDLKLAGKIDRNSMHALFFTMMSISPDHTHIRHLLCASLDIAELCGNNVQFAEVLRLQELYLLLTTGGPQLTTEASPGAWRCSCSGGRNDCMMLLVRAFLYAGGRDIILQMWPKVLSTGMRNGKREPLSPSTSKRTMSSSFSTDDDDDDDEDDEDDDDSDDDNEEQPRALPQNPRNSLVSVGPSEGMFGAHTTRSDSRAFVLGQQAQAWVLRLLWRFTEIHRADILNR
jgi:hypothetical protein